MDEATELLTVPISQAGAASSGSEDIILPTEMGPLRLVQKESSGIREYLFFTPYDSEYKYPNPSVLLNISNNLVQTGFSAQVDKPLINAWVDQFKRTSEYAELSEEARTEKIRLKAKTQPGGGRFGRVRSFSDTVKIPRDVGRALVGPSLPGVSVVHWDGENTLTAYVMQYSESIQPALYDYKEIDNVSLKSLKVPVSGVFRCSTFKRYQEFCDLFLDRSWQEDVDLLLKMNELASSLLLNDRNSDMERSLDDEVIDLS